MGKNRNFENWRLRIVSLANGRKAKKSSEVGGRSGGWDMESSIGTSGVRAFSPVSILVKDNFF